MIAIASAMFVRGDAVMTFRLMRSETGVSAVPDEQSTEVGGIQNTATNLGASLGTAISGSILIAAVSAAFLANIQANEAIPPNVKAQAEVELAGGVPFVSDADLQTALDEANVDSATADAALAAYAEARLDGLKAALAILALLTLSALFLAPRIPRSPPKALAGAT